MEGNVTEVAIHAIEGHLVLESVKILVVGMTTVFAFLWLLIMVLKAQGWFLTKFFPQQATVENPVSQVSSGATNPAGDNLLAAIMAAVNLHRKRKK